MSHFTEGAEEETLERVTKEHNPQVAEKITPKILFL